MSPNNRIKKIATIISTSVATFLCLLKIFASIYTGSLSILSSMVDSLSDIIGSLVTFFAVHISSQPASEKYRYGYSKAEPLSALFQSAFIAGSAAFILYDCFNRLVNPQKIEQTTLGIIIMIVSLVATGILILYQKRVFKITGSQAILADSAHYKVDILTTSSIIFTLFVVQKSGLFWIDSVIALLIAAYLLYNAYALAVDAIKVLMDKELNEQTRADIKALVLKNKFAKGIHDLRTRDLGGIYTFEFHLELDGCLSLSQAHDYAHQIEDALHKTYPHAQIIIHQEPFGIKDKRLDAEIARCCKHKKNRSKQLLSKS